MTEIDLKSWDRRAIYEFFSPLRHPYYTVSFRLDVTELVAFCRREGLSFNLSMVYLVTQAVNGTEAFLYTIEDGEVFLLERREPSFTDRRPDEKYFHIVTMPCRGTMAEFCSEAAEKSRTQSFFLDPAAEGKDLIYLSSVPWLDLTGLTNERGDDHDDVIPRIAWGKHTGRDGRRSLCMSLELDHRFVDGADIGAFAARLEALIAELGE